MKTIRHGQDYLTLHNNGHVSRIGFSYSGQWKVTGAVRYNNFGYVAQRISLETILKPGKLQWFYKNGKQRLHICDLDHGTSRVWMSPKHEVFK